MQLNRVGITVFRGIQSLGPPRGGILLAWEDEDGYAILHGVGEEQVRPEEGEQMDDWSPLEDDVLLKAC